MRGLCFCSLTDNVYFCHMNDSEYWKFIRDNANADPAVLRLTYASKRSRMDFDFDDAVMQIEARRKSARKIPWFLALDCFRFPSLQASEQASNQAVSLHHARLVGAGKRVADLTAGLGIDAMTIALQGNQVDAFEMEPHRAEVLGQNAWELCLSDFNVHAGDSMKFLRDNPGVRYDWLFIDPARRDTEGRRIFKLQDSLPNVIDNMDLLLGHASDILIKASPLLDISQTIHDLEPFNRHWTIEIVSYRGEVKEVLIHMSESLSKDTVGVVDIADAPGFPHGDINVRYRFDTDYQYVGTPRVADADDIVVGKYLYEAGAGMRKLRCAPLICGAFPYIKALSHDAELFVSDILYPDFPGRINIIRGLLSGKEAKTLHGKHLRVVSSRYPVTADDLRRKYRILEGDTRSLIATSPKAGKKLLMLVDNV